MPGYPTGSLQRVRPLAGWRPVLRPHVVATVHVQNVTGNVRSHRRSQEKNGVHYFIGLTETAQRDLLDEILRYFIRHSLAHADIDEAGGDSVNRDLVPGQLACRNLG